MGNFGNRLGNAIGIAPRTIGTGVSGGLDIVSAPLYGALNFSDRIGKRSRDIKEAIANAINTGPNWKRWFRRPFAYLAGGVSYLTGLARSAISSLRDTAGYLLKAVGNTFNNAGSAIMRMGEPMPPKEFSFAKLQPEESNINSVLRRRFPALGTTSTTPKAAPAT